MATLHDTTPAPTVTAADTLAAVTALAPTIAARAGEIEAARRLPTDLVAELTAAGVFRLLLPPTHGGLGADLLTALEVFETLAAADGSTGWTAMIGAGGWIDLAGLPRATFATLFDGSPVITAGAFNPTGSVEAVAGGYRVRGRWAFVSGCEHATLLYANCVEGVVDGMPQLRMAVLTPDQVVIEDTWQVSGLRGTGSHHIRVDGVVVPTERTFNPLAHDPCCDTPLVRIPPPPLLACAVATIALGIARGALDDVVKLAETKVPMLDHAPLATSPTFHLALATADTERRAAQGLVREAAGALWAAGVEGREPGRDERARVRAAAVWATATAARVVDTAYRSGGGSSLYAHCPLQRRLRDVHAVTQHFLVRPDTMATAGAILAGQEVDLVVF